MDKDTKKETVGIAETVRIGRKIKLNDSATVSNDEDLDLFDSVPKHPTRTNKNRYLSSIQIFTELPALMRNIPDILTNFRQPIDLEGDARSEKQTQERQRREQKEQQ